MVLLRLLLTQSGHLSRVGPRQCAQAGPEQADLEADKAPKRPDWPLPEEAPAETPEEPEPVDPTSNELDGDPTPAQQFATAILDQAEHSAEVSDAFDRMPSAVQVAITDELGLAPDTAAPELSDGQLETFQSDADGLELWGEWGEDAPLKAAQVQHRWNRLREAVPESDLPAFDEFVGSLPPAAFKEALRRLAGGR